MSSPATLTIGSRAGKLTLLATILGSSVSFLDSTVVNVALPTIQRELDASLSSVAWVVDAYVLTLTGFILLGGSYGDLFGRRRAFRIGLIGFMAGSILCGLAPTLLTLDVARAIQGVGGAFLVPSSLAILTASFDPAERGRVVGLWASLSGVAGAIGPLVGGFLVDSVSWRAIFFLNIPLVAFALWLVSAFVPETQPHDSDAHLDLLGAATATIMLAAITFGLIQGGSWGWSDPRIVTAFVVGAIATASFLVIEHRRRHPMLPLTVFRNRTFSGANAATFAIYFSISGALLFVVLSLQQVRGLSAFQAGLAVLPLTIVLLVGSPFAGRLADRVGPRIPMTIGPIVAGAGIALLAVGARSDSYWVAVVPGMLVFSVGIATTVSPLTTAVLSALEASRAGVASAVNSAISRFAGLVAVAILPGITLVAFTRGLTHRMAALGVAPATRAAILALRDRQGGLEVPGVQDAALHGQLVGAVHASFIDGFVWAMAACSVLLVIGGLISWTTIRLGPGAVPTNEAAAT